MQKTEEIKVEKRPKKVENRNFNFCFFENIIIFQNETQCAKKKFRFLKNLRNPKFTEMQKTEEIKVEKRPKKVENRNFNLCFLENIIIFQNETQCAKKILIFENLRNPKFTKM